MTPSQVTTDILQNPKYAGAIRSISSVTDWIDSGFGMAITMIAFLIIIVAMLKNVLAAAYCAYPKFWDRVDTAHKEVENTSWKDQFKGTFNENINGGSLTSAVFRLLPNIKSITDFEGDTVAPKAYFIRAIPQMILCIIIGAFIYNGFYRDTAAVVVDFGSTMVSRLLLEVDPVAVFDQFTGSSGRPEFSTDDSNDEFTQLVNSVASSSYTTVIGTYNDISSAEAKRALATAVEAKAYDFLNTVSSEYKDHLEEWAPKVKVTLTNGAVDLSKINGILSPDGLTMQYAYQYPVTDLNLSSNKELGVDNWVRIRLNFEKQVVDTGKRVVSDIVLHLPIPQGNNKGYTIPSGNTMYIENATIDFAGENASGEHIEGTVTVTERKTVKVTTTTGSINHDTVIQLKSPLTLKPIAGGSNHYIAAIAFDGKTGMTSASEEAYGNGSFNFTVTDLGKTAYVPTPTPPTA